MSKVTQNMLGVLIRAYQSGKDKLHVSQAARHFAQQCGFGSVVGNSWLIAERDRRAIRAYLIAHYQIADPDTVDFSFAGKSRVEAAGISHEEKFAGAGPHDGYVLVRAISGVVGINGKRHEVPGRSCLYVDAREIESIDHDCLIVVENFEAVKFADVLLLRDCPYHNPLLAFRGDAAFPANGARSLAELASIPVLAWTDLDPQGVNIAASVPQVSGAIFPCEYGALSRADLYDKQRFLLKPEQDYPAGWLEPLVAMRTARRGLTQEAMIAQRVPCKLFSCELDSITVDRMSSSGGQ